MNIGVREARGIAILDLEGRFVAGDGEETFREVLGGLLEGKRKKILLNLAGVTAIDSAGVGELVEGKKLAERYGARLKLLEARGRVRHVLDASLLLPVFEHFTEEAAALASFD
jgi:anti-sigma B factor antagonist